MAERLVALLRAGNPFGPALGALGISRDTFERRMRRQDAVGRSFRERGGRADAEARDVVLIAEAATSDWRAAAWTLEREYPDRWGPHGRALRALRSWPDD